MMTAAAFWKNERFAEYALQEISGACVDIEAACIICGDGGWSRTVSKENLARWWLANKDIVICVYAFLKTLSDGAKPKAY